MFIILIELFNSSMIILSGVYGITEINETILGLKILLRTHLIRHILIYFTIRSTVHLVPMVLDSIVVHIVHQQISWVTSVCSVTFTFISILILSKPKPIVVH